MPTCWNGNLGIDNDHINHMAYTVDGSVAGACPPGFNRRLPQIQLFVRISPYKGGTYVLSDESDVFHVDFMNGWKEGTLQRIIDECPVAEGTEMDYNPPCNCAEEFLTVNEQSAETPVCDNDVRNYIVNEATDVVNVLPRGTCSGPSIIDKSWTVDPPFNCNSPPNAPTPPTPTPPTPTPPTPTPPTPTPPTPTPPTPTPPTPTPPTPTPPTPTPPTPTVEECSDSTLRFKFEYDGEEITRSCRWVARKDTEERCAIDGVSEMCADTCGTCSTCADTSARFKFRYKGKKMTRDCEWVERKSTEVRCDIEGIYEACRETCEAC